MPTALTTEGCLGITQASIQLVYTYRSLWYSSSKYLLGQKLPSPHSVVWLLVHLHHICFLHFLTEKKSNNLVNTKLRTAFFLSQQQKARHKLTYFLLYLFPWPVGGHRENCWTNSTYPTISQNPWKTKRKYEFKRKYQWCVLLLLILFSWSCKYQIKLTTKTYTICNGQSIKKGLKTINTSVNVGECWRSFCNWH